MSSRDLLRAVAAGAVDPDEAERRLRVAAVREVAAVAHLDVGRSHRIGIPEVVLAQTKTTEALTAIVRTQLDSEGLVCVSRARAGHRRALTALATELGATLTPYGRRAMVLRTADQSPALELVGLLAAGTGDMEILDEARMVLEAAGVGTRSAVDVGVAGLHRLAAPLEELLAADPAALIVAAGMDGALPSVVAGLAGVPVIGVPTSTGYGAGGKGRGALLAMLQSCSPGLVVVNIDNGVGAGAAAALIALRRAGRTPAG